MPLGIVLTNGNCHALISIGDQIEFIKELIEFSDED